MKSAILTKLTLKAMLKAMRALACLNSG